MKTRFGLKFLLLAGLMLGSGGCYFTSVNPLPKSPHMDRALLGCWKTLPEPGKPGQEAGHMIFLEDKDGYFQVVLMEKEYQYDEIYRGFCSDLAGDKFLNVKLVQMKDGMQAPALQSDYYLVHYRIEGRKLEMTLLKEEPFKAAAHQGLLKGKFTRKGKDFILTDSSDHLAAFIKNHKLSALLDEKLVSAEKTDRLSPEPRKP